MSILSVATAIALLQPIPTPATGAIQVTVSDTSGAAVLDAEVVLAPLGRPTSSDAGAPGRYRLSSLACGRYRITVGKRGFAAITREVVVEEGVDTVVPVTLAPLAFTESIVVEGAERTVSSATRTFANPLEVPQSVEAVSEKLMKTQAALSVQDVLLNATGVTLQAGEGRRDQVAIRGFSALNDTYADGMRDDARYYRDLSNVEQMEVVKGPAAALYGRGSSGGIVNRVTKRPRFGGPFADVSAILGSYDRRRVTADLGGGDAGRRLSFRLAGAYEASGSHRPYATLERTALAPSAAWRPSDRSELLLQTEFLFDDRLPDRGNPSWQGRPLAEARDYYYGYPADDFLRNRVMSQALTWRRSLGSRFVLRSVLRNTTYGNAFSNTYPGAVREQGGRLRVSRSQYDVEADQHNLFDQTDLLSAFRTGPLAHDVLVGFELGRQASSTVRHTGTAAAVDVVEPVLTRPQYSGVAAADNAFVGRTAAVYVQDQIAIGRWRALLGARFDAFDQALDDRTRADRDLARLDREVSPRAGLVFRLTDDASLYGSVSRSFQPSGDGLSLAVNNEDLKPERATSYEVGAKADIVGGRLGATASLFRLARTNVKTIDPLDPTRLVLVGRQQSEGIELSLAGNPAPGLDVRGGVTFLDPVILRSNDVTEGVRLEGHQIGNVARRTASLWVTWSRPTGPLVGGGVFHQGAWFASNDNLVRVPGYTRLDALLGYRLRRYEVALNLRNLLGERYYESAHGNNAILPAAGRNALLSVRARF